MSTKQLTKKGQDDQENEMVLKPSEKLAKMNVGGDRLGDSYANCSQQYFLTDADRKDAFDRQYDKFYEARVKATKHRILANADKIFGKGKYKAVRMNEAEPREEVFVLGVLVKRLTHRPGVLKALLNDEKAAYENFDDQEDPDEGIHGFISDNDYIEFESDQQIVKLEGNIKLDDCSTGCCAGLLGFRVGGLFTVKEVVWPSVAPQPSLPPNGKSSYVVLVSGLDLTGVLNDDMKTIASFGLLSEWLKSGIEANEPQSNVFDVNRLVVLGQSLQCQQAHEVYTAVKMLTLSKIERKNSFNALRTLDRMISGVTDKIKVDLLPGFGDPTSAMWPQPPIHRVSLPRCGQTENKVNLVTNPYEFQLNKVRMLCTSGENVTDLLRLNPEWSGCDVMAKMLDWQHIAPTCPDTLDGFPMAHRDALFLTTTPHVLVAGNQTHAETRWVDLADGSRCLTICLPKFAHHRLACVLDLASLELKWHSFEHDY